MICGAKPAAGHVGKPEVSAPMANPETVVVFSPAVVVTVTVPIPGVMTDACGQHVRYGPIGP